MRDKKAAKKAAIQEDEIMFIRTALSTKKKRKAKESVEEHGLPLLSHWVAPCAKCGASANEPCAHPNHNFHDCPQKAYRREQAATFAEVVAKAKPLARPVCCL